MIEKAIIIFTDDTKNKNKLKIYSLLLQITKLVGSPSRTRAARA